MSKRMLDDISSISSDRDAQKRQKLLDQTIKSLSNSKISEPHQPQQNTQKNPKNINPSNLLKPVPKGPRALTGNNRTITVTDPRSSARSSSSPTTSTPGNNDQHVKPSVTSTPNDSTSMSRDSSDPNESLETPKERPLISPHVANETNDDIIGLREIIALEYAVGSLQQSIKTIVSSEINEAKLKLIEENPDLVKSPQVFAALQRSKISLSTKLKGLYDSKKLKIFDDILNYEENHELTHQAANKVELTTDSSMKTLFQATAKEEYDPKTANKLPKLPEIKDPKIRARVFVHKSIMNYTSVSTREQMNSHNERYEFIGDSVLNNIMTFIVTNYHPNATEGDLSQLRSRLVSNASLLNWSYAYGFDKKLQFQWDDTLKMGKQKMFADVFEAYVGGLIIDNPNNYNVIYEWLRKLALPILNNNSDEVTRRVNTKSESSSQYNANAKSELYSLIGFANLGLKYVNVKSETKKDYTNFTVNVVVKSGEVLGTGEGKNVKEAGQRAAMNVLANSVMIEKYSQLRASIPKTDSTKPVESSAESREAHIQNKKLYKEHTKAQVPASRGRNQSSSNHRGGDRF